MVTDTPVKRGPGRPSTAEKVAAVHASSQAAREHRRQPKEKEDLGESLSPVPKRQLSTAQSRQKARHFALKAAILTPDIDRFAVMNGERISYILENGLLHQTNARRRLPPYRPTRASLHVSGLNDAQIAAAFGP